MIKHGEIFCPACLSQFPASEALFDDYTHGYAFQLKGKTLVTFPYDPQGIPKDARHEVKKIHRKNGVLSALTVHSRWSGGSRQRELKDWHRICPYCFHGASGSSQQGIRQPLLPLAGLYPSYFLYTLGSPASGKSTWISAISSRAGSSKAARLMTKGSFSSLEAEQRTTAHLPTSVDEISLKKTFLIQSSKGRVQAILFCFDTAGEFLLNRQEDRPHLDRITRMILSQADGLLCFYDTRSLVASQELEPFVSHREPCQGDPLNVIAQLQAHTDQIPRMINILTRADELWTAAAAGKGIRADALCLPDPASHVYLTSQAQLRERRQRRQAVRPMLLADSPLLREELQLGGQEILLRHMALSRAFLQEACPEILADRNANFVLSSGRPVEGTELGFDYRAGINVHLPMVYLLNSLGLVSPT